MINAVLQNPKAFKSILETVIDAVITTDSMGKILFVNHSTTQLFGYSTDELIGQSIELLMPNNHRRHHASYMQNYKQTGQKKVIGIGRKIDAKKKNGEMFPCWLSLTHFKINGDDFFTGIIKDYSELEQAHQELAELNQNLEQKVKEKTAELEIALQKEKELNHLKSKFLTLASHEFKTPLATILSSTILIEKHGRNANTFSDAQEKHVERIKRSVNLLNEIIEEFINLEKIEKNKIDIKQQEFNLYDFLNDCIGLLSVLKKEGQIVELNCPEHLLVHSDYDLSLFVLMNLLSNAIKYSKEQQKIVVNVTVEDQVLIHVIDQGIGIPHQNQQFIFERFYRSDNSSNVDGTGIGLHIAKRYANLLGGDVSFTSEENKGSHFIFSMPK